MQYGLKTDKCEGVTRLIGVGWGRASEGAGSRGKAHQNTGLWVRSGHTPPRGKAKGAGGLDPKSMEALIKYVIGQGKHGIGKLKEVLRREN